MYYNLSDEQKIFLHVSYSMLEEGYDVDQILEFWSLDDEDKVKEIFESVTLSEEIDTSNPDFLLICEKSVPQIPGLSDFIRRLFGRAGRTFKVKPPTVKTPTQTAGGRPITSGSTRPSTGATVTRGSNQGAGLKDKVTTTLRNNKAKIIGGAAAGGAVLGGAALLNNILPPEPGDGNDAPRPQPEDKDCRGPGGCADGKGQDPALGSQPDTPAVDTKKPEDGSKKGDDPKETKPKSSYGWWMLHRQQPDLYKRSPGYRVSRQAYQNIRANPRPSIYDNFDLIADYLINEGHASTIEEAEYVMNQLDEEFIQSIIENK
tara:strand:- start:111 stop:1061 length:951 start_codon:yes stop_codon:yes gene_type:complete